MEPQFGSVLAALILAAVYALEGRLLGEDASERFWARRRWISAAAGVSVAYIFVDVLPELAAQQREYAEATENAGRLFSEARIYILALLAFVTLYGLDHIVLAAKARQREGTGDPSLSVYWLHLFGFAAYSGLIGYLLVDRAERGPLALATYTFAMVLHFCIVAHSLREKHGAMYHERGRWLLMVSVLAGCLLGTKTQISEVTFARLFALLAGGVVITSLKDELPDDRKGRFWPFCAAALLFALVLLWSSGASEKELGTSIGRK